MFINKTTWQNNPNKSYIERKAIHEPFGYSLDLVSSSDPNKINTVFIEEDNVPKNFVKI